MELTGTRELLPRVLWRESSPSTNAELRELVAAEGAEVPHGTLLATSEQTAGRGRLGRDWVTPVGTAVAASILIRDFGARAALPASWLPLIAGSAVTGALQPFFASGYPGEARRVGVKWPNDVHVRSEADAEIGDPGKKLCGILCEMLPDGAVVVGMGINLLVPEWELPTDRATSLLAAGAELGGAESLTDSAGEALLDRVLHDVASGLLRLTELAEKDPAAVRIRVARHSLTLGSEVRVHLPNEQLVDGRARELADDGSLVVDLPTGGQLTVSAGDVQHLR
ncbi:biotin--[acetyl-CoA-carboxylase] ligase [Leucobacter insecticola]|uniref:biotin--[biotin carboxyl-carrier protein] ligase n=1 Tax=Leucobacter insecticola TaxID=2714934 RepID=A0A6G8FH70_9MICO|nr:biotin--[acetyl-CoA-carboxylase] ligase [Leucobacter insecticola]QIM15810.1 biotin--[acetyl-CoA-carboxylase] ligase [Leucobacter insecticola]